MLGLLRLCVVLHLGRKGPTRERNNFPDPSLTRDEETKEKVIFHFLANFELSHFDFSEKVLVYRVSLSDSLLIRLCTCTQTQTHTDSFTLSQIRLLHILFQFKRNERSNFHHERRRAPWSMYQML